MKRCRLKIKETCMTIIAEEQFIPVAVKEINKQRFLLEEYIKNNPVFKASLLPCRVRPDAPDIVRRMAEAGKKVGVGPMAAVAGAIAEYTARAMVGAGARHIIVDNGGDIALYIDHPVTVGIYTGHAKISDLGLRLEPRGKIFGICTSSGSIGHSLNLGISDAAVVIADDVLLADAVATSVGNRLDKKEKKSVQTALEQFMFQKINGIIAVIDDIMGICGDIPHIVELKPNRNIDCQR
ncbi:MAG: UPF0280 family protein [Candidatus Aminicenantes bacterium]|nr:UPF0280 family protein [Candidatus Aminicenantes bacterium]